MATTELLASEWTARPLRPVARWTTERHDDGTTRLVMRWAVPDPVAPTAELAATA